MLGKLLILLLTLSCFTARFHCALEQGGLLPECCDATGHELPYSTDNCDGCPDFEGQSTSLALKVPGTDPKLLLLNPWASRLFAVALQLEQPEVATRLGSSLNSRTLLKGPRQAIASHTTSLRGPPVLA